MHTTPEFALTRADYRLLSKAAASRVRGSARHHAIGLLMRAIAWCLLSAGLFLYFRLHERLPEEAATMDLSAALIVLGALLATAALVLGQLRLAARMVVDGGAFMRRHSLTFTDSAMRMDWATGHAEVGWSNVIGKASDGANHYLFVDASAAYVVPRQAVASFQADFDRWFARLPA